MLTRSSGLRLLPQRTLSDTELPGQDQLPIQAARILEHIETIEELYAETIEQANADLKNGLRVSAVTIRAYLDDIGFQGKPDYQAAI